MALSFDLSPTQSAFVASPAHICQFIGPMGEGKTFAGGCGVVGHAARCRQDIRGALVRDTHQNIKTSTIPDLQEMFKDFITFHDDGKMGIIHSNPKVKLDLFGIDDPASLSKLQGPQYSIIWLEEPAPIAEKANAGLSRDVFEMAVARAARQKGGILRVQITQNPAEEDHWTEQLAHEPEIYITDTDAATGVEVQIIKKTYRIPSGENQHLNPLARAANKAAFKNDPGKWARYVEGRAAPLNFGESPCPGYTPNIHYSESEIEVIPGAPGVRGWDGWHHPVCLIGQLHRGQLIIHQALRGDGTAVRQFIGNEVAPAINSPKYRGKVEDWQMDAGDPTMTTPDQSDSNRTAAKVVENELGTRFVKGPTRWPQRIDPLNEALAEITPRGPKIIISRTAYPLHRALNGGWHFKVDNNRKRIGNIPVKDEHADYADALCYLVARIFKYENSAKKKHLAAYEKLRKKGLSRARSYAA